MKKSSFISIIVSMVLVLCISFGATYVILNFGDNKTFSTSYNLNEQVNDSMTANQIAAIYTDSCVTVLVQYTHGGYVYTSSGSGVCVAAKGYTTEDGYVASRGAYIVTNYHVISYLVDTYYVQYNAKSSIVLDRDDTAYSTSLLWYNKDMDVALLYCDEDLNIGWITMKDRSVACASEDRLKYDDIFVIGSPLGLEYKNTFTKGNISNNHELTAETASVLYTYRQNGVFRATTDDKTVANISHNSYIVAENFYENMIMMNCDITNGNSGGGVFDLHGNLIGLATLGMSYTASNTNAMNFLTPIYPVSLVLDSVITNNENGSSKALFTPQNIGLDIIDAQEGYFVYRAFNSVDSSGINGRLIKDTGYHFFLDQKFYAYSQYESLFSDNSWDGVYVLANTGSFAKFKEGFVITGVDKNDLNHVSIQTRNDLLYFLLTCQKGETLNIYGQNGLNGVQTSFTITL